MKKEADLSYTEYSYYPMFDQRLEVAVIEELLSYSDELKVNYRLLHAMSERNFQAFERIINEKPSESIVSHMKIALKTFR